MISDTQISSRPDDSSTLSRTIAKLVDSVSKLNQLLQEEGRKIIGFFVKFHTENKAQGNSSSKGNGYAVTRKAMEIRTGLINDAERFHRGETYALQFPIESSNKEHGTNTKQQIATEIITRPAIKDGNQKQTSSGKNNNNNDNDNDNNSKDGSEY